MSKIALLIGVLMLSTASTTYANESVTPTAAAPAVVPSTVDEPQKEVNGVVTEQSSPVACSKCRNRGPILLAANNEMVPPVNSEDEEDEEGTELEEAIEEKKAVEEKKAFACGCKKGKKKKGSLLVAAADEISPVAKLPSGAPSQDAEEVVSEAIEGAFLACDCPEEELETEVVVPEKVKAEAKA